MCVEPNHHGGMPATFGMHASSDAGCKAWLQFSNKQPSAAPNSSICAVHLADSLVAEPQHDVETRQPSKIWNEACIPAGKSAHCCLRNSHAVHYLFGCCADTYPCRMLMAPHSARCPYKMRPQPACVLPGCVHHCSFTCSGTML